MAVTSFLDFKGLRTYDGLIKNYIGALDLKNFKSVAIEGNTLKFYKVETPTADAPYTPITLPSTDISNLLSKITGGVKGNIVTIGDDGTVVDSGIASTDIATKTDVTTLGNKVGNLENLKTTEKSDTVSAINEIKTALDDAETAHKVDLTIASTPADGMLKTYVISQGEVEIGTIDIPKDLVVTSGLVVTDPLGQEPGTYIELIIANQSTPLYINVKDLVDAYTAQAGATQIQLAISNTNEISATIVAGSVTATELAENAVTTAKIADGNVTLAKLSQDLQTWKSNIDTALGDGGDVATKITNAIKDLDATVESDTVEDGSGLRVQIVETDGKLTSVTLSGSYDNKYDAKGAAATSLTDAKAYADGLNTAMDTRVDSLEAKVGDGYEAITTEEINSLFAQG